MTRPPEITGWTALRGVAALWIVLFHFWPQTAGATPQIIARGYLAVDLFFCLSGAVMMLVHAPRMRAGTFRARSFLWHRFARLYPVHLVTLILAAAILTLGPLVADARPLPYDMGQMIALHLSLLHAWGITETGGLNYPSWSIAAEAFAYLLFPLLALPLLRLPPRIAMVCALVLAVLWIGAVSALFPASPFTRLENDFGALRIVPEFLIGMALAHLLGTAIARAKGRALSLAALALMGAAIATETDLLFLAATPLLLSGLLLWRPAPPRALLWLGRISYSLYMVHALVQIPGFKLIEMLTGAPDRAAPLWSLPLLTALSLCAAAALCRWVETPARRWLLRRGARPAAMPQRSGPSQTAPPAPARP